ncbi:putative holin-like toxin [Paenibacillus thiaminolyticus]
MIAFGLLVITLLSFSNKK